ncbi:Zn-dependent peptidase, M16 (insulinase) family [Clostridium sp. DSM 8431]|uniref:hypothetical protein n=1 Tax=Clostridium sp. DSM 8431 TaxID=1761781 RepID=UPI0008F0457A|nr:hypothetical protein [Clostridium sp. DSM 8431]SFU51080.1 Zn-dependent peptidase, M16 (insulinase) family [Clostridium sp. DSM 8431]
MNQYKLCKNYFSNVLGIEANIYDMRGIKIIHANSENGKFVFKISIPIKLTDNKGVAHIMEHSIASEIDLSKFRSILSAETNMDKIVFTIYSESEEDLLSSINITLKELYSPKFLKKEEIYLREGIDYYYDSTGEKLTINGVVYNEMKSIKSNPMELIKRLINVQLFKGSNYGYQCGGDSSEIAKSVYGDVISFYKDNYNTPLIYLYGNIEISKVTELIGEFCMNNYNDYDVKANENFKCSHGEYSYLSESMDKNIVSFSYNIGKFTAEKYMYLQYLKEVIYTDIDKIFGNIEDMSFAILINDTYRYGVITFFFIANNESIYNADACFDKLKKYISKNICKGIINEDIVNGLRRKMFNLFELSKPFEIKLGDMILNRESYDISLEDYLELPQKEFSAKDFIEIIESQIVSGEYSRIKVFPRQYDERNDEAQPYLMRLLKDSSKEHINKPSKKENASAAKKENNFKRGIYNFIDVKTYEYKNVKVFNQVYEDLDREYVSLYLDISHLSIKEKQVLNVYVDIVNSIYGGFYNNNPSLKDNVALKIINFNGKENEIKSKLLIILATAEYREKNTLELLEKYLEEIRNIANDEELLKKALSSIFKDTKEMDERSLYRLIKILTNGKFSELGKLDFQLNSIYTYKFVENILQGTEIIDFKDIVEEQLKLKSGSIISYHSIKEVKSSIEKFVTKQIRAEISNIANNFNDGSDECIKDIKSLGVTYDTNMLYMGYGFKYDYEDEYEFNVMSLLAKYINSNYLFPGAREKGVYFVDIKTYYSEKTVVVYIMRFSNIEEIISLMDNLKTFIEKEINMEEINYYKQQLIDYKESFKEVDYRYSDKFVMDYINEEQNYLNNIDKISEADIKRVKEKFLNQINKYFRVVIGNKFEINKSKAYLDKIEKFI